MNKKVALGLSGGVDSALSAYLLLEKGYDVTAVYIECWNEPGCRAESDRKDALEIAMKLGIPFRVIDYKNEYKAQVMQYFLDEYRAGRTPNPDVICNKIIKFGLFYDWAINKNNFDFIATGHYAQIEKIEDVLCLTTSVDEKKDQTYFMHLIKQEQLSHILFPIGHLKKSAVRIKAKELNITVADKKDSVGICFVGDINVKKFIKENLGENPGKIVTESGEVVGSHNGLWFYTIGQRQGFDINTKKLLKSLKLHNKHNDVPPLYVIGKNREKNELVIGIKRQVFNKSFTVGSIHWINKTIIDQTEASCLVRIRHTGQLFPCKIISSEANSYQVISQEKIEGIASGQSAVFYLPFKTNYICLGGGVITDSLEK